MPAKTLLSELIKLIEEEKEPQHHKVFWKGRWYYLEGFATGASENKGGEG